MQMAFAAFRRTSASWHLEAVGAYCVQDLPIHGLYAGGSQVYYGLMLRFVIIIIRFGLAYIVRNILYDTC